MPAYSSTDLRSIVFTAAFSQSSPLGLRRRLARTLRTATTRFPLQDARRPIFVIGAPRSGTTLLYDLLRTNPNLRGLPGESQTLWMTADPRFLARPDDSRDPNDIDDRERAFVHRAVAAIGGTGRYIDKFPRNCFRIEYLVDLFPDASFVFVRRDGREVVSSMITGWEQEGRFTRPDANGALSIDGYDGDRWKFVKPPGWGGLSRGHSLAYVCARQWVASVEAVLDARPGIAPSSWVDVAYEDLLATPVATISAIMTALTLPTPPTVLGACNDLVNRPSATTVTPPEPHKWRRIHATEIERVMPLLAPTLRRLGYYEQPKDDREPVRV